MGNSWIWGPSHSPTKSLSTLSIAPFHSSSCSAEGGGEERAINPSDARAPFPGYRSPSRVRAEGKRMMVTGIWRPTDDPRFLLRPWLYLALPLPPLTPRPSLRGGRGGLGGLTGGTTGAAPAFQSSAYCCPPPEPLASSSAQMQRNRGRWQKGREKGGGGMMQMEGKWR